VPGGALAKKIHPTLSGEVFFIGGKFIYFLFLVASAKTTSRTIKICICWGHMVLLCLG
jgi:hypothetical protein